MEYKDITFPWFSNRIESCKPSGEIALASFNEKTKHPVNYKTFARIEAAKALGNRKLVAELKEKLYYFTPAIILRHWRNGNNIVAFTGLCPIDFDKMTPAQAHEFKAFLFHQYQCFYSVWLSASRHGVRGLIRIPAVSSIEEYKSYFFAIQSELSQYGYHFDTQLQTPVQPMFQSYDPDILYREDPDTWDVKAELKPQAPHRPPPQLNIYRSARQKQSAIDIIQKGCRTKFNQIVNDDGHPRLRGIGLTLGGYVGGGYLTETEAILFLENEIDRNAYLSQKAETYKKTARWAIGEGIKKPLELITESIVNKPTNKQLEDFHKA